MRWMRAAALAAGLAAAWPVSPAPAQTAPAPAPAPATSGTPTDPSAPIDVDRAVATTFTADSASLVAQGATPAERDEAARRLMARQSARADQFLLSIIL